MAVTRLPPAWCFTAMGWSWELHGQCQGPSYLGPYRCPQGQCWQQLELGPPMERAEVQRDGGEGFPLLASLPGQGWEGWRQEQRPSVVRVPGTRLWAVPRCLSGHALQEAGPCAWEPGLSRA